MNKLLGLFTLASCSLFGASYSAAGQTQVENVQNSIKRNEIANATPTNTQTNKTTNTRPTLAAIPTTSNAIPTTTPVATPTPTIQVNPAAPRAPDANLDLQTQINKVQANAPVNHDLAATFKDGDINKKIRAKIEGWYAPDYKDIHLNTKDGVVTLSGTVEKQDVATDLAAQIKKIDGVKDVINNVKTNVIK